MNLTAFLFETRPVRVAGTPNAPLFVVADVGEILELRQVRSTVAAFDDDEKGAHSMRTLGGEQEMLCVTEAGLYRLIFKSRKEAAKRFQKWILSDVIPSIRRTGSYTVPQPALPQPAPEPVTYAPREIYPDKYYPPVLTGIFAVRRLGSEGNTRARFTALLSEVNHITPSVAAAMIDAAIIKGLLDEHTEGTRLWVTPTIQAQREAAETWRRNKAAVLNAPSTP